MAKEQIMFFWGGDKWSLYDCITYMCSC